MIFLENALRLLCVLPEYQKKEIGTMLLKQSEEYIKKQGSEEILTGVANWYAKPGYKTIVKEYFGVRKFQDIE